MKCISVAFALLSSGIGLVAAWYWYRASKVTINPTWAEFGMSEPGDSDAAQNGWLAGLVKAGTTSADLNKKAAGRLSLSP